MEEFNIACNSKRLILKWHTEGKLSDETTAKLLELNPDWK